MAFQVFVTNPKRTIAAAEKTTLLALLRSYSLAPEAPCGGHGTCGKCKVLVDGIEQLACQTVVDRDMTVTLPEKTEKTNVLETGLDVTVPMNPIKTGYLLAFDIGTTTVVGYLLDEQGREVSSASMLNPQEPFGADVISRIQLALNGEADAMTTCIRAGLSKLTQEACEKAGVEPSQIGVVCVVGNPCMQQLFLGMSVKNLATVPFAPSITKSDMKPAKDVVSLWENAVLLTPPDISGYVGADTMGCILSTRMYASDEITLMVDIGTNGEMALGNRTRMTACSTAAGPALEGAKIKFGMRGAPGAIDHVWVEDGKIRCSVIGGGEAKGICGSGLIDAAASFLELGLLNARGRLLTSEEMDGERIARLTDTVYITQNDIREVQMAKGAIAAGISLMAQALGIEISQIDKVLLAGAFGSFLKPESACRISLLPPELLGKITAVGNAAGSGAKMMACSKDEFARTDELISHIEFIELASLPDFQREFAKNMRF